MKRERLWRPEDRPDDFGCLLRSLIHRGQDHGLRGQGTLLLQHGAWSSLAIEHQKNELKRAEKSCFSELFSCVSGGDLHLVPALWLSKPGPGRRAG